VTFRRSCSDCADNGAGLERVSLGRLPDLNMFELIAEGLEDTLELSQFM